MAISDEVSDKERNEVNQDVGSDKLEHSDSGEIVENNRKELLKAFTDQQQNVKHRRK